MSADLPLQIDLLNVEDLELRISFKTDISSRPRFASQVGVRGWSSAHGLLLLLMLAWHHLYTGHTHWSRLCNLANPHAQAFTLPGNIYFLASSWPRIISMGFVLAPLSPT